MISRRRSSRSRAGGGNMIRLVFGLIVAAFAVISFLGSREYNPVTSENQYLTDVTHLPIFPTPYPSPLRKEGLGRPPVTDYRPLSIQWRGGWG